MISVCFVCVTSFVNALFIFFFFFFLDFHFKPLSPLLCKQCINNAKPRSHSKAKSISSNVVHSCNIHYATSSHNGRAMRWQITGKVEMSKINTRRQWEVCTRCPGNCFFFVVFFYSMFGCEPGRQVFIEVLCQFSCECKSSVRLGAFLPSPRMSHLSAVHGVLFLDTGQEEGTGNGWRLV